MPSRYEPRAFQCTTNLEVQEITPVLIRLHGHNLITLTLDQPWGSVLHNAQQLDLVVCNHSDQDGKSQAFSDDMKAPAATNGSASSACG